MSKSCFIKRRLVYSRTAKMLVVMSSCLFGIYAFIPDEVDDAFFKQFGISKTSANGKIINSFLGGYLDAYGLKGAKDIALDKRSSVTTTLLEYAKTYVSGDEFKQAYSAMREQHKPEKQVLQTPESMQEEMIANLTKSIAETEAAYNKADETMKPVFESVLASSRQMLKDYQNPENPMIASYRQNFDYMVQINEEGVQKQIDDWNLQYPVNHALYVKMQLEEFLLQTENIDFNAQVVKKEDKMIFVKPEYEAKSDNWKMAFRAGKEVVLPAREFVKNWILTLK
ncbi:MAG: hypothetical protein V1775_02290 [Bacteroidota bacterium]